MSVPLQELTAEVKRLRRVNAEQAAGWKSCSERLRDAEAYILVLEQESKMWESEFHRLANEEEK